MPTSSGFQGMDTAEVQRVADQLDSQARALDSVLTALSRTLEATHWAGPDRDKFVSDWNGTQAKAIRQATADLRAAATSAKQSVAAQQKVSRS